MAQDLTKTADPAAGPQNLAWLARNPSRWTTEAALKLIGAAGPQALPDAVAKLEADLSPVPADPKLRASWNNALDERLRRLAVKVSPGMSVEQSSAWRDVMVDALADLPALVALTAAKRALHRPMTFMNEIETVVREIAAEVEKERRQALWRLRKLKAEIDAAAQPKLAAPEGWEGGQCAPLSADELRRMPKFVLQFGITAGHLSPEELEAAGVIAAGEVLNEPAMV